MKYLDEYRDPAVARRYLDLIAKRLTRPVSIMEVCGGQTHSILQYGIDQLVGDKLTLIHGPGCPVCVTPVQKLDRAVAIAERPGVIFCSYGDMLRVPGTSSDLLAAKARGADVRVVYSALDALQLARAHPTRKVVFFAVGFETTAPATAMAAKQALALGLENFFLLVSHVLVPPIMAELLASPACRVDGFLAAGHVCTVTGYAGYHELASRFGVPIVVTGFEPLDILQGLSMCVAQLEAGEHRVENQYSRVVSEGGNEHARRALSEVFELSSMEWRGLGLVWESGFRFTAPYRAFDAEQAFSVQAIESKESPLCQSGKVLLGLIKPPDCAAFGDPCTPERPLGAPMVSTEGTCAAYHRYRSSALPVLS
jgi:hydrogenase expression/formation protein HypD